MNIYKLSEKYDKLSETAIRHSEIRIRDNSEILIEDCREVLQFDENVIKLRLACGTVTICGIDMKMRNYSERGAFVSGKLHSIGFDDNGKERVS